MLSAFPKNIFVGMTLSSVSVAAVTGFPLCRFVNLGCKRAPLPPALRGGPFSVVASVWPQQEDLAKHIVALGPIRIRIGGFFADPPQTSGSSNYAISEDDRSGEGEGDDEWAYLNLAKLRQAIPGCSGP